MTQPTTSVCPYVGLAGEPATARLGADSDHRCYAQVPPGQPDEVYQERYCVSTGYRECSIYAGAAKADMPAPADAAVPVSTPTGRISLPAPLRRILPWALAVLALAVIIIYARDLFRTPAAVAPTISPWSSPVRSGTPSPLPLTNTPLPLAPAGAATRPATATPEAGGRMVVLSPKAGEAGWFGSGDARGNHLGDSYLYAGYWEGQALISAVRIGLDSVPRGAPLRAATLELTGLNDERFDAAAGGTWSVQLLAADALPNFSRATFQDVLNAPAAVTLVPTLFAADLSTARTNTWMLDARGCEWLARQVLDGATAIIARVIGPSGGSDTLFAWDSGSGPSTLGEPPRLVLNLGAPPATAPALPTEAVIVATLTPTPANVLTAVAYAIVATDQAGSAGTPLPYRIVTPTPPAENLATAQAYAASLGLPPLVVYTPTPANSATAESDNWRATAVAVTTGTFTPVPTNAVTPVIVTATQTPRNAATALAQALTATAAAAKDGTPTPWGSNVLLATFTPTPVSPTATPANEATAVIYGAQATLTAMANSALTPVWPGDRVQATPTPTRTARPRPAATAVRPARAPSPTATASGSTSKAVVPHGAGAFSVHTSGPAALSQLARNGKGSSLLLSIRQAIVPLSPEGENHVGKENG